MINIVQRLVSQAMYGVKCPYDMTPQFIVVHNTANDASAANEIAYMSRNGSEVSFHFAVDDVEVIQAIPTNRNAWHAGDGGNGNGNRMGIAYEICYSKSGGERFIKAEILAAKVIAQDLHKRGWSLDRVKKHQDFSGKYCPHRTLDMGWERFLNMVQAELNVLKGVAPVAPTPTPAPSGAKYAVGTPVCVNRIWTQSNGGEEYTGDWSGTITKVIPGAEHPYLINDNTGWTNDTAIDTDPHVPQ